MASLTDSSMLPDYAPVPASALGPAVNEQCYDVGQVERNLYWVIEGVYQCAFLTAHTTFWLMESLRLDLGVGSQVHP